MFLVFSLAAFILLAKSWAYSVAFFLFSWVPHSFRAVWQCSCRTREVTRRCWILSNRDSLPFLSRDFLTMPWWAPSFLDWKFTILLALWYSSISELRNNLLSFFFTIIHLGTFRLTSTVYPQTDLGFLSPVFLGLWQDCPLFYNRWVWPWVRIPCFMRRSCLSFPSTIPTTESFHLSPRAAAAASLVTHFS